MNEVNVSAGTANLTINDPSHSVSIRQTVLIPTGSELLQLTADVATEGVQQGAKTWHVALVFLVDRTAEGSYLWRTQRLLSRLTGDTAWSQYSVVFPVADDAAEVVVWTNLSQTSGAIHVRNFRLSPVSERTYFLIISYALLAAWAAAFARICFQLLSGIGSISARISVAIASIAIITGVMVSGTIKSEILTFIWNVYEPLQLGIDMVSPKVEGFDFVNLKYMSASYSQIGHFTLFFMLAALIKVARPADRRSYQILGLLLFAATTEALQYFVPNRQPTVFDWLFDGGGILLALALISLFQGIRRAIISWNSHP